MSDRTHVPDKLQGYLIQVRHMLCELISLDLDHIISVEAYDDVAIEQENAIVAEQIKSVSSDNNPIANRAVVFWKTLYNWCYYIDSNALPAKALVLRFVVIADRNIYAGSIAKSFAEATDDLQAKQALKDAINELYGNQGEKESDIPETYRKYVAFCLSPQNESLVIQVIKSMSIEVHVADYDQKLQQKFDSQLVPHEYADELFVYMLGWVMEKVQSQTKENKPAYITVKEYRDALQCQIRGRDLNKILSAVSTTPEEEITEVEVDRCDTYIKQLELIEMDATDIFTAANDFLRASVEKTLWAKKGLVTPQNFDDYYDGLKRTWNSRKQLIEISPSSNEVATGKALYYICTEMARPQRLQGSDVPSFFGSGCLHTLANEPPAEPQIGWHPRYIQLLKQEGQDDEQCKS